MVYPKGANAITYTYNPAGQRVTKTAGGLTTYYVRDAQGNTMAIYDNKADSVYWREQELYGSSRLGMWKPAINLATDNAQAPFDTLGRKFFELTNHLGNVLVTITDRRVQAGADTVLDHYDADIATAQDYYAFGMLQPGRTYSANGGNYRYGFNGKENDDEVKGEGNQQDYGMRIYDPRVGRFLSVDPLRKNYPMLTPYQFASDNPIFGVDQDGLEFMKYDKRNTATIVFPADQAMNDDIIKAEYQRALHSNMNVVLTDDLNHLADYLKDKGTKYKNLIFTGHGTLRYSSIRMGSYKYSEYPEDPNNAGNLHVWKDKLQEIGSFVKKDGAILLLGCFQASPKYSDKKNEIELNGEALIKELAAFANRNVIGNQGDTYGGTLEFSGKYPLGAPGDRDDGPALFKVENMFAGKWSMAKPNGQILPLGNITLNGQGQWGAASTIGTEQSYRK